MKRLHAFNSLSHDQYPGSYVNAAMRKEAIWPYGLYCSNNTRVLKQRHIPRASGPCRL